MLGAPEPEATVQESDVRRLVSSCMDSSRGTIVGFAFEAIYELAAEVISQRSRVATFNEFLKHVPQEVRLQIENRDAHAKSLQKLVVRLRLFIHNDAGIAIADTDEFEAIDHEIARVGLDGEVLDAIGKSSVDWFEKRSMAKAGES
jgi:hypothetical protein